MTTTVPPVRTTTEDGASTGPASIRIPALDGGVVVAAAPAGTATASVRPATPPTTAVTIAATDLPNRLIAQFTQCPSVNASTITAISAGNTARYAVCNAGRRSVHRASSSHSGNHTSVARPTDR